MKTTIDLPPELVKQLKLRAVKDGRKMKDVAADLLRTGLKAPAHAPKTPQPVIQKDKKTGLPVIQCPHPAAPGHDLAPDRIADLLNDQEAESFREPS